MLPNADGIHPNNGPSNDLVPLRKFGASPGYPGRSTKSFLLGLTYDAVAASHDRSDFSEACL